MGYNHNHIISDYGSPRVCSKTGYRNVSSYYQCRFVQKKQTILNIDTRRTYHCINITMFVLQKQNGSIAISDMLWYDSNK